MITPNELPSVARDLYERCVTYLTELLLIAGYAAVCVVVIVPVMVATGAGIYWGSHELALEGTARLAYFAVGVVVLMVEFGLLYRFVNVFGLVVLGPTRDRQI